MPAAPHSPKRATGKSTRAARPAPELIFGDLWEYDPAPETADPKLKARYDLFIDGKFVAPKSGKYFDTINPANEQKLAEIARAGAADVDAAFQAARRAYDHVWSRMPGRERAKYLFRIARLLQDRAREFAVAETLDGGKPIKESRDFDVPMAAAHFFYHAGWADKLDYVAPGRRVAPLGVVGQVIPWNFPLLMGAWKIAPALAMGNCVVLKPAETTSITCLKLAEILQDAGLPAGVVNFVTGAGEVGAAVMGHAIPAKVAFTGSTEVGKIIMRSLAGSDKRMTMELGGKAANIVFDDAPLDQAVEGIVNGIFFNQGHVCCAGSRLLVHESVAERVLAKLKNRLRVLRVGDPMDKNTDLGAINSREQLGKIRELVEAGVKEGAEIFQHPCRLPAKGFYFRPTLFSGVSMSHRIAREEIFGPVLAAITVQDAEEAVRVGNGVEYGLAAAVWTRDIGKAHRIAKALRAGMVYVNCYDADDITVPFGGFKQSGTGRDKSLHAFDKYTELKTTWIDLAQ